MTCFLLTKNSARPYCKVEANADKMSYGLVTNNTA